eukprot:CAMPEP_0177746928 /NCGR_PEP_ID=MMETSP0484_2-20121128/31129_1 /TAXON_ID=354590 /ORGANISM="Rhodomonas lens, Strain RHODO" /LENGTH=78 /DNA_ID=CAMNT_0019261707 /DNA_START=129 /DNA_END=362 /DNA_ORIENTATION=-
MYAQRLLTLAHGFERAAQQPQCHSLVIERLGNIGVAVPNLLVDNADAFFAFSTAPARSPIPRNAAPMLIKLAATSKVA